jgi:hypothetical protein
MSEYAVYNDRIIINVVIGENKEIVEEATGMKAILTNNGQPWMGWQLYEDNTWRPPQPYPSWIWNGLEWAAPISMPTEGLWSWDEDSTTWIEVVNE